MADPAYSFASPRRQLFSFPPDVISSMLNNPSSPKGLMKLYQTCKYFYGKRPILISDVMVFGKNNDGENIAKFNLNGPGTNVIGLQTPIWLTKHAVFNNFSAATTQLPQFVRSSVTCINMEYQHLPFETFVLLTAEKTVKLFFAEFDSHIYHPDGSKATIDQILEHLPNIEMFDYFFDETCSLEMLTKLNQIKLNKKFVYIRLEFEDIHPTFDINLFCEFIMKNCNADTGIIIQPCTEAQGKLKVALQKLDQKWKNEAHDCLQDIFRLIDRNYVPTWQKRI